MKRLHVSLAVAELETTTQFYTALFGSAPTMERDHYVQWVLDDPAINFVIEDSGSKIGLSHLGIQANDEAELQDQFAKVSATGSQIVDQGETQCCYAKSTKNWVVDPDGIPWETFLTHSRTEDFGEPFVAGLEQTDEAPKKRETARVASGARCC